MSKLLIVDDNQKDIYLLQALLEGNGCEVAVALNGAEALEKARRDPPDIIISDILMPVMDGFTLCYEWRRDIRLKDIPFVFYTATYTDARDEELAMKAGADMFICKPVEPDEFMTVIQKAIKDFEESNIEPRKPDLEEEKDILKLYNERLILKLEEKMLELEKEIAERIKTENSLRLSEEKFSKAFRSSPTLMSISTLQEDRFIDVNDAFIETSGYGREEIIGRTSLELGMWAYPVDRNRVVNRLCEHGIVQNEEIGIRIKTGKILTTLFSAEIIYMESEPCVLSVALNITESKKLQSQLLHAQKMESIGRLAGGVAHDFNNILTAIVGFGNLIKMKLKEDDPLKTNVDYILSSAEKAAYLTQSLLTFSRKQKINPVYINLNEIIRKLEKFLLRIIGEDIAFKTIFTEEELNVMADINEMEQVLMNLITNARDAMPRGGLLILKTQSVKIDDEFMQCYGYGKSGMYALISISDTGMGMDGKTKEMIFEPFFTTKEVNKGTGLGLSIIYGIIKQHNGYINVYSEPGTGTTFNIYLPLIKQTLKVSREKQADVSVPVGGTETILVAEDDTLIRKFVTAILTEFGYRVIAAEDGEDAINKFVDNKDSIQFVISDVIMPKKSGRELYEKIKSIKPEVKILFLSGYSKELIHKKDLLEEGIEIIPKPVKPDDLLRKIRKRLDM